MAIKQQEAAAHITGTVGGVWDTASERVRPLTDLGRNPGSRLPDELQVAKGGVEGPDVGCERRLIQLVGVQEHSFAEEIMSRT